MTEKKKVTLFFLKKLIGDGNIENEAGTNINKSDLTRAISIAADAAELFEKIMAGRGDT